MNRTRDGEASQPTSSGGSSSSGHDAGDFSVLPFSRLRHFELLRVLSSGGMGVVYVARDSNTGQLIALKLVRQTAANQRRRELRLQRESRAVKALKHPHIVPIIDFGIESGVVFLAMQMIDGIALDCVIEALRLDGELDASGKTTQELPQPDGIDTLSGDEDWGTTPLTDSSASLCVSGFRHENFFQLIAERLADIADAVHSAHGSGIVHRDVKPSNILLDIDGKAWLTDFGLASFEEELTELTQTGELIGTPAYMSPEQASGRGDQITHLSDVYSLGATLYELATLQKPFLGDRQQILQAILDGRFLRPSKVRIDLPKQLEAIICRAMALEPHERYASASEFAQDLRDFAKGLRIQATLPTPLQKALRWCERNNAKAAAILAMIIFCIVVAFGVQSYHSWSVGQLNAELSEANEELIITYEKLDASQRRLQRELHVADLRSAFAAFNERDVQTADEQLKTIAQTDGAVSLLGTPYRFLEPFVRGDQSRTISEHRGAATQLALSSDGRFVISAGHDGVVRQHDLDGREIRTFPLGGKLDSLTLCSDESFLTGVNGLEGGNRVRQLSLESDTDIATAVSQRNSVESVAVSPSGRWYASADRYGEIFVFDADGIRARWESESRNESLAFLNDDQMLGIFDLADGARNLYLWDIVSNQKEHINTNYNCEYFALARPNGVEAPVRILAAASDHVALLTWPEREVIAAREKIGGRIRCVDITSDGNRIAIGTDQGTVLTWDVSQPPEDGKLPLPRVVDACKERITDIELFDEPESEENGSESGTVEFVTSSESGAVKCWTLRQKNPLVKLDIKDSNPQRLLRPFREGSKATKIYLPCLSGKLFCLDVESLGIELVCEIRDGFFGSGVHAGNRFYIPISRGVAEIDAVTGTLKRQFNVSVQDEFCKGLVRCKNKLVGAWGNKLAVFDLDRWTLDGIEELSDESARNLVVFPDETGVIVQTEKNIFRWQDGQTQLWKQAETAGNSFLEVAFSGDGKSIALLREQGIDICDLNDSSEIVIVGSMQRGSSIHFIDDDSKLLVTYTDGAVRFLDLASLREIGRFENTFCSCDFVMPCLNFDRLISFHSAGDVACWYLSNPEIALTQSQ